MKARIFFLHIPKCAGTTLHAIIERNYEPEEIFTVPSVSWSDQNFRALRDEWPQEKKDKIKVVKGHMLYGWHEAFQGDEYTYITLLRKPIERVISYYMYVRSSTGHYMHGNAQSMRLEEFVSSGVTIETSNHMTRHIACGLSWNALARAKKNLERFSVVGFTESFDDGYRQMAQRFGWSIEPYKRLNTTPLKTGVGDETLEIIAEHNRLDIELYQYARGEFGTC